ncbi:MAG TPA: hypothetical protein VM689_07500 [Aliidongia sp.]|nr:hypothetical protein [Aliidongia sp.]
MRPEFYVLSVPPMISILALVDAYYGISVRISRKAPVVPSISIHATILLTAFFIMYAISFFTFDLNATFGFLYIVGRPSLFDIPHLIRYISLVEDASVMLSVAFFIIAYIKRPSLLIFALILGFIGTVGSVGWFFSSNGKQDDHL